MRISSPVYEELRINLFHVCSQVVETAAVFTVHARRKTISQGDIAQALPVTDYQRTLVNRSEQRSAFRAPATSCVEIVRAVLGLLGQRQQGNTHEALKH